MTRAPDASCTVICVLPCTSSCGYTRWMSRTTPKVLHDGGVDAAVHALAEVRQGLLELMRLDEHVEGEVDPHAARMGDGTGLRQLVERELRAFVAGVVHRRAEVDGVGAVGDGGAHGVEGAGGGEQFRDSGSIAES